VGVDQFYFDPVAIFEHGQWWRLFTFPFMASFGGPIHLIFYCLYVYFVMQTLESHWGAGPLTLFMLVSYIMTVAAGLVFHAQMDVSYYVLANISLALGTLLPNLELSLYFLIPVKAKWLAMLSGAFGPGGL
jgi:membrane associated rhomboid family serine protease